MTDGRFDSGVWDNLIQEERIKKMENKKITIPKKWFDDRIKLLEKISMDESDDWDSRFAAEQQCILLEEMMEEFN